MKRYAENLAEWNLYEPAERLLGEYISQQCGGIHKPEHRRVYHDKRITKDAQERIKGFAEALHRANHGAP